MSHPKFYVGRKLLGGNPNKTILQNTRSSPCLAVKQVRPASCERGIRKVENGLKEECFRGWPLDTKPFAIRYNLFTPHLISLSCCSLALEPEIGVKVKLWSLLNFFLKSFALKLPVVDLTRSISSLSGLFLWVGLEMTVPPLDYGFKDLCTMSGKNACSLSNRWTLGSISCPPTTASSYFGDRHRAKRYF